jgi:hypothetical protein
MTDIGTLRDEDLIKGDTFNESMEFYTLIDDVNTPFDLTVYSDIRMDVRDNPYESANRFISLSLGNGISIGGDDNNVLIIELSEEDTDKLVTNYNQFATNPSNKTSTLQTSGYKKLEYFYFRDIRFVIGASVSTKLNGRYKVTNNITSIP